MESPAQLPSERPLSCQKSLVTRSRRISRKPRTKPSRNPRKKP